MMAKQTVDSKPSDVLAFEEKMMDELERIFLVGSYSAKYRLGSYGIRTAHRGSLLIPLDHPEETNISKWLSWDPILNYDRANFLVCVGIKKRKFPYIRFYLKKENESRHLPIPPDEIPKDIRENAFPRVLRILERV